MHPEACFTGVQQKGGKHRSHVSFATFILFVFLRFWNQIPSDDRLVCIQGPVIFEYISLGFISTHTTKAQQYLAATMNVFKREVNSSCLEFFNIEMVDTIMTITGATENDFSVAAEVLEEIGFTVGQKLMERCANIDGRESCTTQLESINERQQLTPHLMAEF